MFYKYLNFKTEKDTGRQKKRQKVVNKIDEEKETVPAKAQRQIY